MCGFSLAFTYFAMSVKMELPEDGLFSVRPFIMVTSAACLVSLKSDSTNDGFWRVLVSPMIEAAETIGAVSALPPLSFMSIRLLGLFSCYDLSLLSCETEFSLTEIFDFLNSITFSLLGLEQIRVAYTSKRSDLYFATGIIRFEPLELFFLFPLYFSRLEVFLETQLWNT